jgi:uncharacterized protein
LRSWWSFVSGRGRIWQEVIEQVRTFLGSPSVEPLSPADRRIRSDLERLYLKTLDRGLKVLIVLTGGPLDGRQSYREQLFEALPNVPFQGRVSVEHFKDADHTFTSGSVRARLQELVLGWITTNSTSQDRRQSTTKDAAASVVVGDGPGRDGKILRGDVTG